MPRADERVALFQRALDISDPKGSTVSLSAPAAAIAILIPFLLAIALAVVLRHHAIKAAARDLAELATLVAENVGGQESEGAIRAVVETVYGKEAPQATRDSAGRLLRALAFELKKRPIEQDESLVERIASELLEDSALDLVLQAVLLLFLPALFVKAFFDAARTVKLKGRQASFYDNLAVQRCARFLAEEEGIVHPSRFGLALVLGLATAYLFAPIGLKASMIAHWQALHALPGEHSNPSWFEAFSSAPPFSFGIAGFVLYSLSAVLQRYVTGDLNRRMVLSLLNRGIVAMILGLVLGGISSGDVAGRALAFLTGVFPQTGLQAIAKTAQLTVERITLDAFSSFRELPEIDLWKETSLREWGISSIHDLALADWHTLAMSVGFDQRVLLQAADRALLLDVFGAEPAARLAALSIRGATDVVRFAEGKGEAPIAAALGVQDVSLAVERLQGEANVCFLREATFPDSA